MSGNCGRTAAILDLHLGNIGRDVWMWELGIFRPVHLVKAMKRKWAFLGHRNGVLELEVVNNAWNRMSGNVDGDGNVGWNV